MLELNVYCIEKTPHLSMPVTGLRMLEEQKKVRLSFEIDRENRRKFPYAPLLGVYGGGKRILFDLADGYGTEVEHAQPWVAGQADFVFRRSFSPKENEKLPPELGKRIHPLGFHFHVSCPKNPIDEVCSWNERKSALFQYVCNGRPRSFFTLDRFECPPKPCEQPKVLFYTRLWHVPENDELYENVVRMNQMRVRLVKELRKCYGRQFMGGIQFDPKEVVRYGSLMVGIPETRRMRYLQMMHMADICIGSTGLHDSIGWKTAEYIAASKAVVNEALCFEVPGNFREGVNYLSFTSAEECLAQVEHLMADPECIYEMALANQTYYRTYVRPDRMMANALKQVFPDWEGGKGLYENQRRDTRL